MFALLLSLFTNILEQNNRLLNNNKIIDGPPPPLPQPYEANNYALYDFKIISTTYVVIPS